MSDQSPKQYAYNLVVSPKSGKLEVPPTFTKTAAYFHPLPDKFQDGQFKVGDLVNGTFGFSHPTEKKDKRGAEIFIRYFIPKT